MHTGIRNFIKHILALWGLFLLIACETNHTNKEDDPNEKFNRQALQFNLELDESLLKPVAKTYDNTVSDSLKDALGCFLSNLKEPYYAVNYLFSGNIENTFNAIFRFVVNTLVGGFGIADVGDQVGLDKSDTSYKDTLTALGIETGDYLVLPIFGPSSTRDAVGEVVSWFCDPVGYFVAFPWMIGKAILGTVHDRAEEAENIDNLMKKSMDVYVMLRSIYQQKYKVPVAKRR